jgi:hypothetical protein
MSNSGDNFSFLNWIFFILLIYAMFLIMVENMMNLVLIPMIITLLGVQITIFFKTKKPQLEYASVIYDHTGNDIAMERYKQDNKRYKKKYQIEVIAYVFIFLIPMIFTSFSLLSIFDFNIGISFFISAFISTICMVILIKMFNIGNLEPS